MTRRVKELEKQAADLPAISARADKLKAEVRATHMLPCAARDGANIAPVPRCAGDRSQNRELTEKLETLQELLEAASAAESMVEELGAQKMMLEDRVSQLQATVEDLEVRACAL